jgi:hypothetical protein
MKTLKWILIISATLFLLTFCIKKDQDRFCWECYVTENKTDSLLFCGTYCNKTVEELDSIPELYTIPGYSNRICYNKEFSKYTKPSGLKCKCK